MVRTTKRGGGRKTTKPRFVIRKIKRAREPRLSKRTRVFRMKTLPSVPFTTITRAGERINVGIEKGKGSFLIQEELAEIIREDRVHEVINVTIESFISWIQIETPDMPEERIIEIKDFIEKFTELKKEDSYYGQLLFEDAGELFDAAKVEIDNLSDRLFLFDVVDREILGETPSEPSASRLSSEDQIKLKNEVFGDVDEIKEHVKGKLLDSIYTYVYNYGTEKAPSGLGKHFTKARTIALLFRDYIDSNFDTLEGIISLRHDGTKLTEVILPGVPEKTDLKEVIKEYLSDTNVDDINKDNLDSFIGAMEMKIQSLTDSCSRPENKNDFLKCSVEYLNTNKNTYEPFWKQSGEEENIWYRTGIRSQALSMKATPYDKKMSNILDLILEPTHDFTKDRVSGSVPLEIKSLVEEYKTALGDDMIILGTDFERKNYLHYSSIYDNSSNLHVYSYSNNLTNENKKGDLYKEVQGLVEKFIKTESVVRDARGTIFLEKLFNITKVARSAEIAIDAFGKGKIETGGNFMVDYPTQVFKIPVITPKGTNNSIENDPLSIMKEFVKVGYTTKDKTRGSVFAEDWKAGQKYIEGDKIKVTVKIPKTQIEETIQELSVKNIENVMKKVIKAKGIFPHVKKRIMWTLLNLKRSGDQGQALYAGEIKGVFDTLDFLAATFASSKTIPYLINSDSLKTLFIMIDTKETYAVFTQKLKIWAKNNGLDKIIPEIVDGISGIKDENAKRNILGYLRELYSMGLKLKSSFQTKSIAAGAVRDFINNIKGKIVEKLNNVASKSGRDTPITTTSFIRSQLSVFLYKNTLLYLCRNFFGLISRLHQALKIINIKLENIASKITVNKFNEFKTRCINQTVDILKEIFPGLIDIPEGVDYKQILEVFKTALIDINEKLFVNSNMNLEDTVYIQEFFDFMNTFIDVIRPNLSI